MCVRGVRACVREFVCVGVFVCDSVGGWVVGWVGGRTFTNMQAHNKLVLSLSLFLSEREIERERARESERERERERDKQLSAEEMETG